jgi:GNAT superfamily N-acetyltransferase
MLSLVDRLSNTGHAGFVNRTQASQGESRATAGIRPVCPADLDALRDFFAGLSPQTRYLRFFAPVTPTSALLRLLSGESANVDVVVAVACGAIVGHAMAADRAEPEDAGGARVTDIGVVVADAWQGQGLGAALMHALITRAQARGATSLAMDVLHANQQVVAMITGHWPDAGFDHSRDSLGIRIRLPRYQPPPLPARPVIQAVRPLATVGG